MIKSFFYRNGTFTPTTIDLGESEHGDVDGHMRATGWEIAWHMPDHQGHEFAPFQVYCWVRADAKEDVCLVDVWNSDQGLAQILCPDITQALLLLRDVMAPLLAYSDRGMLMDEVLQGMQCLFDEDRGLECAQRVKGHQRYLAGRHRAERQAPEQQKAKTG